MTARLHLLAPSTMPDFAPPGVELACREPGVDPEVFFPLPHGSGDEARAICSRCPAEIECGDWATWNRLDDGIWGGLTPEQRKARGVEVDAMSTVDAWVPVTISYAIRHLRGPASARTLCGRRGGQDQADIDRMYGGCYIVADMPLCTRCGAIARRWP